MAGRDGIAPGTGCPKPTMSTAALIEQGQRARLKRERTTPQWRPGLGVVLDRGVYRLAWSSRTAPKSPSKPGQLKLLCWR